MFYYECSECQEKISDTSLLFSVETQKHTWVFVCERCKGKENMPGNPGKTLGSAGISITEFMQLKLKLAKMQEEIDKMKPLYRVTLNLAQAYSTYEKTVNDPTRNCITGRAAYEAEKEFWDELLKHLDKPQVKV